MAENNKTEKRLQNVFLQNRNKMSVSGVSDVTEFDEQTVIMYTDLGQLTVKGRGMHVSNLNLQTGDVEIQGEITALGYSDNLSSKVGFFSRIFK